MEGEGGNKGRQGVALHFINFGIYDHMASNCKVSENYVLRKITGFIFFWRISVASSSARIFANNDQETSLDISKSFRKIR